MAMRKQQEQAEPQPKPIEPQADRALSFREKMAMQKAEKERAEHAKRLAQLESERIEREQAERLAKAQQQKDEPKRERDNSPRPF